MLPVDLVALLKWKKGDMGREDETKVSFAIKISSVPRNS